MEHCQSSPDSNVEAVRQELLKRSVRGLEKYGVTTNRTDLSVLQWLTHLQEELMDAAIYIERLKGEYNGIHN
jgi:Trm5-related predicted tRNA methylase